MKLITIDKMGKPKLKSVFDTLIYVVCYALILLLLSTILPTVIIDNSYYGIYGLLAALIINILNKTIKPILFWLTIPITGVTMGLFYPCINILILKIADWILGPHFETHGIISLFLTAILISVMNVLMEELILKPLIKRSEVK